MAENVACGSPRLETSASVGKSKDPLDPMIPLVGDFNYPDASAASGKRMSVNAQVEIASRERDPHDYAVW